MKSPNKHRTFAQSGNQSQLCTLLYNLRSGCPDSFNIVYQTYFNGMYKRVLYLVKDDQITDELVQDLFLKVWVKREDIDLSRSFRSYLYTIANNLIADHFREIARDKRLIEGLIKIQGPNFYCSDQHLEERESRKILNSAIESLTPQRKKVFVCCKLQGYSYQEASEELGISVATVNTHISHSFKLIRKFMVSSYS